MMTSTGPPAVRGRELIEIDPLVQVASTAFPPIETDLFV
jgi:hypothetical protein